MDIRKAVQECIDNEEYLGRPKSWGEKREGRAVDLARRFCPSEAKVVVAMAAPGAATGHSWTPTPSDLLGDWEVVTLPDLREEIVGE